MADKKISALTASTTPLAGTEVLPIVQGASTVKVSVANLTAGRSTSVSELISDDGVQGRWTVTQDSGGNKLLSTTPGFGGWRTGQIQANGTGANMVWGSDGNTTVGVGNLVIGTSGKGIDFAATAGTGTSELFADYEEGNWTPTVTSSGGSLTSYTSAGAYTKVGRQVTIQGWFEITTAGTASGQANIANIPFTALNVTQLAGLGVAQETLNTGNTYVSSVNANATTGIVNSFTNLGLTWLAGYRYIFSITYQAA
jgi:hypothetical protein